MIRLVKNGVDGHAATEAEAEGEAVELMIPRFKVQMLIA